MGGRLTCRPRGGSIDVVMMGWVRVFAVGLVLLAPRICLSDSLAVVVNEVLYDPQGRDTGGEFIELYNRTDRDVCLYEYEAATGNGAYPDKWKSEWRGGRGDTVRAHGFFVIGEGAVTPVPDHVTTLDLQNGPDACMLVSPAGEVDLVGWGAHDFEEYYEGSPAPLSGSGASLGRDPDGADTGDNSADFTVFAAPSPGDFNHPPYDLAMARACLSRYSRPDHATLQVICLVENLGTAAFGRGARVHAACAGAEDTSMVTADIPPGASRPVAVDLANTGEGLHETRVWLTCALDRRRANDSLVTSILVRPAPVVINEFMFKPPAGGCEWAEVFNRSDALIDLGKWTLEDSGGRRRAIAEEACYVAPGGYLVLVEDEEDFRAAHPDCACPVMRPAGGWPTLNDSDGRDGSADMVVVRDSFGTCVDSVAYAAAWGKPGRSIERIDARARSTLASNWSPHFGASAGSPGRPNSVSVILPEAGGFLSLGRRTFSPDGDGSDDLLSVSVEVPEAAVVRLRVFDINGRPFKTLLDGDVVEERRVTFWDGTVKDGRPAPVGVYIVLLEAVPVAGGRAFRAKAPVVLVRR